MKKMYWCAVAIAVLCCAVTPAQAGWMIVDADGTTSYLSDGKIKNSFQGGGFILDGKKEEFVFYNDKQKIYAQGTVEEYCKATTSMMDEVMKNVPAEQREMMKQMMGGGSDSEPPKVKVVDAGAGEKIAGFKTTKYKVMVNGELYEEVWLTNDSDVMKEYKPIAGVLGDFVGCSQGMVGQSSPESTPEYQQLLKKGLNLRMVNHEEKGMGADTKIVKLEKKKVPDSEFKAPAGYKKVSFSDLMQAGMGME